MSFSRLTPLRLALVVAGGLLIAATWLYLVLTRPVGWESVAGSTEALITLGGYLGGAALLLGATLPQLPARSIALIPVALVLNIAVGELVGSSPIPLYFDSFGTVLVAAIAGPIAGLATGALTSVVWGFINPAALPFAAVSALVGLLAGLVFHSRFGGKLWAVIISGGLVGVITAMIASPVAAFVYGGTAGLGTGAVVSLFRELGNSLLGAVTLQSLASDPLDKALVFLFVWLTLRALPKRTLEKFEISQGQ